MELTSEIVPLRTVRFKQGDWMTQIEYLTSYCRDVGNIVPPCQLFRVWGYDIRLSVSSSIWVPQLVCTGPRIKLIDLAKERNTGKTAGHIVGTWGSTSTPKYLISPYEAEAIQQSAWKIREPFRPLNVILWIMIWLRDSYRSAGLFFFSSSFWISRG